MKSLIRLLPLLFLCINVNPLSAQLELIDTTAFQKIRVAELTSSQIPMIAHYLTDVAGSRLTNSPGFFRAGKWAVATMKKWGLQNAALEPWGDYGRGWEIEEFSISMKQPYNGSIIGYPFPWSSNTVGEVRAQVYKLSSSNLMDSLFLEKHRNEIRGKIILVTEDKAVHEGDSLAFSSRLTDSQLAIMPDTYMYTRDQIDAMLPFFKILYNHKLKLKSLGALALINAPGKGRDGTVTVYDYAGFRMNSPVLLPEAIISSEDGFKLERLIASGHKVEIKLLIKGKYYTTDTKGYNVIAEIPGTDPKLKEQLVMLGGHLDSWAAATGATDNAAGCIVMMEAVRLLDSLHLKPKRTIRIALWGGEEQGLFGSYNYVKNHFGNAEIGVIKTAQTKVSGYFNLDNGTGKIRGVFAQGDTAIVPIFESWLTPFHDLGATTVTLSNAGSTDHESFDWVGIPGFQFIQDPLDYESKTHHSNMDTYDNLRIDDLKQAAIIVASFIYQASIRPDMLPRKKLVKEKFVFDGL